MRTKLLGFLLLAVLAAHTMANEYGRGVFDHSSWDRLLSAHVEVSQGGQSTVVDYDGMMKDRSVLKKYLHQLMAVSKYQFDRWPSNEQLAFLINAYNAWTVELILTQWPNLSSIKDLGGFFRSPWDKEFLILLGATRSLDDIEHGLIRESGKYKDPRIHFAVNCASIGCPALRVEAYSGSVLDQQLDAQTTLFLSDQTRNRVDGETIRLSSIFKWYRGDFEKGWHGFNRLEDFLLVYVEALNLSNAQIEQLKNGETNIEFLDYDWRLNKK